MADREIQIHTFRLRDDAIKYVQTEREYTLVVDRLLDAARPSGEDAHIVNTAIVNINHVLPARRL